MTEWRDLMFGTTLQAALSLRSRFMSPSFTKMKFVWNEYVGFQQS